jgi:hypothetical protein
LTSNPKISTEFTEALRDILDRPIAFHRAFVKLAGSITAALMLSQAMYWSKRATTNDEGWFFKTREQWEEETGLSRFEQEGARKALRGFSFWKEELRGVPARMHYRVDMAALFNEIICMAGTRRANSKPNRNVSLLETSQQDGGNPADKKVGTQPASLLDAGQHYKGLSETTAEIKTTTYGRVAEETGGGRDFVEKLLAGSILRKADPVRISKAAVKYKRTTDEIEKAIDVLDQQYRQSTRKIDDPTALIVSALKDVKRPGERQMRNAEQRKRRTRRTGRPKRNCRRSRKKSARNYSLLRKRSSRLVCAVRTWR